MKSKKEIRILYDASEKKPDTSISSIREDASFLASLGIILPCTRAILCQGEALYEKRFIVYLYQYKSYFTKLRLLLDAFLSIHKGFSS